MIVFNLLYRRTESNACFLFVYSTFTLRMNKLSVKYSFVSNARTSFNTLGMEFKSGNLLHSVASLYKWKGKMAECPNNSLDFYNPQRLLLLN